MTARTAFERACYHAVQDLHPLWQSLTARLSGDELDAVDRAFLELGELRIRNKNLRGKLAKIAEGMLERARRINLVLRAEEGGRPQPTPPNLELVRNRDAG